VFAIKNIPKGIEPLRALIPNDEVKFTHKEVKELPRSVQKEMQMFCYYDDKHFYVPRSGMNAINMGIYLNHSKSPNVQYKKNGQLVTLRRIKKGEELLMDYDINFGFKHVF
jgi:SET domain-containing protein